MAKNNSKQSTKQAIKKPQKRRRKKRIASVDIVALIVFIAIAVGVTFGAIWYYGFHMPRAASEMEDVAVAFTQEYFDVHHDTISGNEGLEWLTANHVENIKVQSERVKRWQAKSIVSRVENDIEVQIIDRGWNSGRVRVIFWQYEEVEGEGKDLLMSYDYEFAYEKGSWLIDRIVTASPDELTNLRRARGVLEQHQDQEDEDDQTDDQDNGDEEDE